MQLFTEMNLTVIISDVDTVWMRNPFEYFKRYPEADILTSTDFVAWTHGDEGLEDAARAGSAYNIGIMMFSPKSAGFAKEWVEVIEADDKIWDQNAFNECAPPASAMLRGNEPLAGMRHGQARSSRRRPRKWRMQLQLDSSTKVALVAYPASHNGPCGHGHWSLPISALSLAIFPQDASLLPAPAPLPGLTSAACPCLELRPCVWVSV